jgi:3-oxoacyl-[acyl-carrier-protein] synthase-3
MELQSKIIGCGSYLPSHIITNQELSSFVDTSDEWIQTRTGICQRHMASSEELTSDIALKACQDALQNAGLGPEDIDLLICATTTPDRTFPATATTVQAKLGMNQGFAFDVQAVCSGFVYGLSIADLYLKGKKARRALLVGAEIFSRLLDWKDRTTCVLFGDGAGAVVLEAVPFHPQGSGVLGTYLHSDGQYESLLCTSGGPSLNQLAGHVQMKGIEVFRHAVEKLSASIEEALAAHHMTSEDVDWLVPHQANQRIIDAVASRLNFPSEKIISTVALHANTSAASIPLALSHGVKRGLIKTGDMVLINALGAGFTWGSALIRW